MIASIGVILPLHNTYVPAIQSLTKVSTDLAVNKMLPTTYENLLRLVIIKYKPEKKTFPKRNI